MGLGIQAFGGNEKQKAGNEIVSGPVNQML